MHGRHAWTLPDADGNKREVCAIKFGGVWRLQSRLRGQTGWTVHEPPLLEDLQELREILWRKYQRRRASHEDVLQIEALIARLHRR